MIQDHSAHDRTILMYATATEYSILCVEKSGRLFVDPVYDELQIKMHFYTQIDMRKF